MKNNKGFTLLETLVAITILTLAVAGPLFTASRAVVAARAASNRLAASYLAQESTEYARKLRDDYYLAAYAAEPSTASTTGWANFRAALNPCSAPGICTFDPTVPELAPCSGACTPLYLLVNHVYSQQNESGATLTPFTRTVQTIAVSAAEERIISTVTWNFHGMSYSIATIDHLTPWQSP